MQRGTVKTSAIISGMNESWFIYEQRSQFHLNEIWLCLVRDRNCGKTKSVSRSLQEHHWNFVESTWRSQFPQEADESYLVLRCI